MKNNELKCPDDPKEMVPLLVEFLKKWRDCGALSADEADLAVLDLPLFLHSFSEDELEKFCERALAELCGQRRQLTMQDTYAVSPQRRIITISGKGNSFRLSPAIVMSYEDALKQSETDLQAEYQRISGTQGRTLRDAGKDDEVFTEAMVQDALKNAYLGKARQWAIQLKRIKKDSSRAGAEKPQFAILELGGEGIFEGDRFFSLGIYHNFPAGFQGTVCIPKPGAQFYITDLPALDKVVSTEPVRKRIFGVVRCKD